MSEHILWETIEEQKEEIADLKKENRLLGERCNQLLKDKGYLTDRIDDIKANCDLAIEGRDVKIKELEKQAKDLEWQLQEVVKDNDNYQAENKRLEQQVEKMKCCKICAYGGNDFGVCYSDKPCKNKNKWKLAKWVNGR